MFIIEIVLNNKSCEDYFVKSDLILGRRILLIILVRRRATMTRTTPALTAQRAPEEKDHLCDCRP